jgi:hypothetical protein
VLVGGQPKRDRGIGRVRDIELPLMGEDVDGEQGRLGVVFHDEDPPACDNRVCGAHSG